MGQLKKSNLKSHNRKAQDRTDFDDKTHNDSPKIIYTKNILDNQGNYLSIN